MDVWIVVGLVVLSGAVAGGVMWYSAKIERERRAAFEARGWSYSRKGKHLKVEGVTDGVVWQYELTRTNSQSREAAMWCCPAEPSDDIVLVGPSLPEAMLAMGFSGMLVQFLAKKVLGEDGAADLGRSRELQAPALAGKASVIGTTQDFADAFLTEESIAAILAVEGQFDVVPAVLRWRDRLEVRPIGGGLMNPDTVIRTVELGTRLAKAAGYS